MTYSESAEGMTITLKRALRELDDHGVIDYADFFEECGERDEYSATEVLQFLGY